MENKPYYRAQCPECQMSEPELDEDGYPTEKTLETIRNWSNLSYEGQIALLNFAQDAWSYPSRVGTQAGNAIVYWFSTGGWSGNEDIVEALMENNIFWLLCWYKSKRGGYYEFIPRKIAQE